VAHSGDGQGILSQPGSGARGRIAGAPVDDRASPAAPPVATAAVDAGVRDLADLAAERGGTAGLRDLQITKLIRAALGADTDKLDAAAFLRLVRADIRRVEALIRAAAREPERVR
jgi:hypothetical protein